MPSWNDNIKKARAERPPDFGRQVLFAMGRRMLIWLVIIAVIVVVGMVVG